MRVAVLAYHSQNVSGNTYESNNHVALKDDLDCIIRSGIPIVSARNVVNALISGVALVPPRAVVLTCDDGTRLDWAPFDHPLYGTQPGFRSVLRNAMRAGLDAPAHGAMTSFVIASAQAHAAIDATEHAGIRITDDQWWAEAVNDGLIDLGCHSWDHCAAGVAVHDRAFNTVKNFADIEAFEQADRQVRMAGQHIRARVRDEAQARLFAYPYGQANAYFLKDYMPREAHGMQAAFTDGAQVVTALTNCWAIPRYVCGAHWRSPMGLINILRDL